ncbi:MAG: nucleotidyltransferase domain-containing protein, partial [Candidatus Omnitrophica bacterium]|nr:nucleotidyltransferase domain-containing protein [Candidatus Omnitrophota bacterium]
MSLTGFLPIVLFVGFVIFMFKFSIEQSKKKLAELRRIAPLIGFTVNNNRYGLNECNEVPPDFLIDYFKVTPLGYLFGSYVKGQATASSDIDLYMESDLYGLEYFEF